MAIRAINTEATKDFVSILDDARDENGEPTPEATVWKLHAMDSYIEAHVSSKATSYSIKDDVDMSDLEGKSEDEIKKSMSYNVDTFTMAMDTCKYCLQGWDNFKGPDGKPLEYKSVKCSMRGRSYTVVDPDLLGKIPKDIILELYVEIVGMSRISEADEKN